MEQAATLSGAAPAAGFALLGYACGLIPTGPLVTRGLGIDLRQSGSGNVGATNVLRVAGTRAGLLTLLGDAAKAALPTLLAQAVTGEPTIVALTATAAVLGHCFPVTAGFAGGKGVASGLGAILALSPPAALVVLLVFGLVVRRSKYVSVGSLAASLVAPIVMAVFTGVPANVLATIVMAGVVWRRHRENLMRLREGTEPPLSLPKK